MVCMGCFSYFDHHRILADGHQTRVLPRKSRRRMNNKSTMPPPVDNLTTMPALLTQPGALYAESESEGITPVYKWIFVLAVLALVAVVLFVR